MVRFVRILRAKLARVVARVGLAIYLLGTLYSLVAADPGVFQRFGSLGVAAAILFFTDRLMQIELNRQRTVEKILHEFGIELEVMKEGVKPTDIPREGYVVDYLTQQRNFDGLRLRAERIAAANIGLLSVATLQWGFGDVIFGWVFR